jgi:hypothetical protein
MIVIFRLQALLALSLGLSAVSLNARAQLLLEHPEAGTILDELREAVGESSSSGAGKSFTRLVKRSSLSVESGQQRWVKPIWKLRFEQAACIRSKSNETVRKLGRPLPEPRGKLAYV